ncbi:Maf family nucleotide pyrophosphatase [Pararhodonellum marinum]|uniref:Maf family nucleotide pyrophosphatase n=1 Tax=Pararhodonellum marinum TaxID=2755358 RepID=UPI00188E16EE|nr:Maf family nucleotide pyrophosphatase [Pararhodonellum marinum]
MNFFRPQYQLILASKSPRRQELLKGLGLEFRVMTKEVAETYPEHLELKEVASFLAEKKAEAFRPDLMENELLICADTTVLDGQKILNKPENKEEAIHMLTQLSGKSHEVITGVCMMNLTKKVVFSDTTKVHFRPLEVEEIDFYVNTFSPYDKAGAYGIQEWIGYIAVERLEGSFYTVMGLPVHLIYEKLKRW